ncbi:MAG: flagellar hook assembly protein FlgD [Candidatus Acidiferrum sp.]
MISPIPMNANDTSTSRATSSPSSSQDTPSNTLGSDSFITLLTAQLQAQDPLSPMDPDQMVSELTSINTLEQITQIRADMDTLVGANQTGQSGTGSGATAGALSSAVSSAPIAAKLYSQLNATSQANSNSGVF